MSARATPSFTDPTLLSPHRRYSNLGPTPCGYQRYGSLYCLLGACLCMSLEGKTSDKERSGNAVCQKRDPAGFQGSDFQTRLLGTLDSTQGCQRGAE